MTTPYRHPKTQMYWLRKAVPETLREFVGKRELKRSLQTRDPKEARKRAPAVLAEFEALLEAARRGQQLSPKDIQAAAGLYYNERYKDLVARARKECWDHEEFEGLEEAHDLVREHPDADVERQLAIEWGRVRAEPILRSLQTPYSAQFRDRLALELYRTEYKVIEAVRTEIVRLDSPKHPEFPAPRRLSMTLTSLFDQAVQSEPISPRTAQEWRRMVQHFDRWRKDKPLEDVRRLDVQDYGIALRDGESLSGKPTSAKRINDGYLAAMKKAFRWAVDRELLSTDPTSGVRIAPARGQRSTVKRPYTREEVFQILTTARREEKPLRRWVPWLAAYTGARISELLNARKMDFGYTQGILYLNIREDAERGHYLKTSHSKRCVPIHPAVLEEGFLDYLETLHESDYLIPGNWQDQYGNRTSTPANRLRDWLNEFLPKDPTISPNHSLRHWLVSECRRARVDGDLQRQLTGHAARDVHGRYGPADVPVLYEALVRIPGFDELLAPSGSQRITPPSKHSLTEKI